MSKVFTSVLFAIVFFMAAFAQSDEQKTYCKVASYSNKTGLLKCTNGQSFSPFSASANKNISLKVGVNTIVYYVPTSETKKTGLWKRISVEVQIVPKNY